MPNVCWRPMRKAPSALAYARAFFTADGRNRGLGLGRAQQGRGATRGGARGGGGGSNLLKTSREWICRLQEYNVAQDWADWYDQTYNTLAQLLLQEQCTRIRTSDFECTEAGNQSYIGSRRRKCVLLRWRHILDCNNMSASDSKTRYLLTVMQSELHCN